MCNIRTVGTKFLWNKRRHPKKDKINLRVSICTCNIFVLQIGNIAIKKYINLSTFTSHSNSALIFFV